MNRKFMLGLTIFAGVVAGALFHSLRRQSSRGAGPDLAERTRWEGEGGAVSTRPVDGPVSEAV